MLEQVAELVGLDDPQVDLQPGVGRAAARRRRRASAADSTSSSSAAALASASGSRAVAITSRSLTLSVHPPRRAGQLDPLGRRVRRAAPRPAARRRRAPGRARSGASAGRRPSAAAWPPAPRRGCVSSAFGPNPFSVADPVGLRPPRSAPRRESIQSSSYSRRARLGPSPGSLRHLQQPGAGTWPAAWPRPGSRRRRRARSPSPGSSRRSRAARSRGPGARARSPTPGRRGPPWRRCGRRRSGG